jgi:diguanylate cyclase (GGDEF)-like protein/PAS domain S-box-containing protein
MSLRRARLVYALAAAVLLAICSLVPPARPAVNAAIGSLSLGAIMLGIYAYRPQRRGAWLLIALSVVLVTAVDVSFAIDVADGRITGYPGALDVSYMGLYIPLAAGLLWLGQPRLPSGDAGMLIDTIALSLAGSLILWMVVVRPALLASNLSAAGRTAALAGWVGFVAVVAATLRVLMDWYQNPALRIVTVGVIAFLVADLLYLIAALSDARGTGGTGGTVDLGFHLFNLLCGAAALIPSMALVASDQNAQHQFGPVRLVLMTLALLVAPTALLFEATSGPVTTAVVIAVVSAAVGALAALRIGLLAANNRRRARREMAARLAARELLLATTEAEVLTGLRRALGSMVKEDAPHDVQVLDRDMGQSLVRTDAGWAVSTDAVGELRVPLGVQRSAGAIDRTPAPTNSDRTSKPTNSDRTPTPTTSDRTLVFSGPIRDLVEITPTLAALADQAGLALDRIGLQGRLRAEERERHFRTLVLTSRDVTLISRRGRVEYATPSAETLFGRDVRGKQVNQIVSAGPAPDDADGDPRADQWTPGDDALERTIRRPDGAAVTVLLRERDLTDDPTVNGIVTTLSDVTAERSLQRDLAHRASHDPLTGLANAESFGAELDRDDAGHDQSVPRSRSDRAALYIDLDDFKAINDTYGHEAGDAILRTTARRIESCLRAGDVAARLGGDEFAVLLRGLPDANAARSIAQRIADALTRPAVVNGLELTCRASIGLAYAGGWEKAQTLLRNADAALYTAKSHGKGRWTQYRRGMAIPTRKRADIRQRLETAMSSGAMRLLYQPIVELATGDAVGYEALLRLEDGRDPITPQEVVKAAEDTGIVDRLGEWTLAHALRDVARLNAGPGPRPRYVGVNVSPGQLRRPTFVQMVRRQVADAGVDPSLLVLEVTEDMRVGDDNDRSWAFLAELRGDGSRVAIDDYGTGHATLSYLRQPGIDIVKIDQSFLVDATSPRGIALLRYITALCTELGLLQIADGVSDAESRDVLIRLGCQFGQGHLYAPALPLEEATAWRARGPH